MLYICLTALVYGFFFDLLIKCNLNTTVLYHYSGVILPTLISATHYYIYIY